MKQIPRSRSTRLSHYDRHAFRLSKSYDRPYLPHRQVARVVACRRHQRLPRAPISASRARPFPTPISGPRAAAPPFPVPISAPRTAAPLVPDKAQWDNRYEALLVCAHLIGYQRRLLRAVMRCPSMLLGSSGQMRCHIQPAVICK